MGQERLWKILTEIKEDKITLNKLAEAANIDEVRIITVTYCADLSEEELNILFNSRKRGWDWREGWMGVPYHANANKWIRNAYNSLAKQKKRIDY